MASINLSGVLRDPLGEVSYGNKIRFTHNTTTGETVKGFRSIETVVINGEYDIDLEYGNVHVETWDKLNDYWVSHGVITINSDTPATSIPALLGITTPATDEDLLVFQALVADAELARDEAVEAKNETEALFDSFDSSVSESLSLIGSDVAFETTFNDSLNISKGYGTHDTITVASETVELPTKSVDFTCAAERTVINKSGVLESVGVDEIAIGKDGGWHHTAYTNSTFPSEGVTTTSTGWLPIGATSITENINGQVSAIGSNGSKMTTDGVITAGLNFIGATTGSGSNFSVWLKGDLGGEVVLLQGQSITLTASWDRYNVSSAQSNFSLESELSQTFYYDGFQSVENIPYELPYIKTESSSLSVPKTTSQVMMMCNLPKVGESFVFEVDCSIPEYEGSETFPFRHVFMEDGGVNLTAKLSLRRDANGEISFTSRSAGDVATRAAIPAASTTASQTKYACRFHNNTVSIFADGVKMNETTVSDIYYNVNSVLHIGSNGVAGNQLNSQIKNLRIHHGYVSDDTIKSWGGAL